MGEVSRRHASEGRDRRAQCAAPSAARSHDGLVHGTRECARHGRSRRDWFKLPGLFDEVVAVHLERLEAGVASEGLDQVDGSVLLADRGESQRPAFGRRLE